MYQCLMWKHVTVLRKNCEVASPICEVSAAKKVAVDGGMNLIIFGFGCHVLASIPRKFQLLRLTDSTFTPIFREFVKTMAKKCAQQKDGTRRLWLRVRCRNLCSNEVVLDYAFQAFISAKL